MIAFCEDGMTVQCEGYKSIKKGVVLFRDEDRDEVIGFISHDELKYIVPDQAYPHAVQANGDETEEGEEGEITVSYETFGVPWFSATGKTK
jgi:hypothetical protein